MTQAIIVDPLVSTVAVLPTSSTNGQPQNGHAVVGKYESGIQILSSAYRHHSDGRLNYAFKEINDAIELLRGSLDEKPEEPITVLGAGRNGDKEINSESKLVSIEFNLGKAELRKKQIQHEINCQVTSLSKIFGVDGLNSDTEDFLTTRAKALKLLGVEDDYRYETLRRAKELAKAELRIFADDDLVFTERDIQPLVEKGLVAESSTFRDDKTVSQWVEEIVAKLQDSTTEDTPIVVETNTGSRVNDEIRVPVFITSTVVGTVESTTDDIAITSASPIGATTDEPNHVTEATPSDATISDSHSPEIADGDKITVPELTELVSKPKQDLITLTAKLIQDSVLDTTNDDELRIVMLVASNKLASDAIKSKNYNKSV